MADDGRVWERQAELAWNGFYRQCGEAPDCNQMERFLAARCSAACCDDRWRDWNSILRALEILGDGYKTHGWITRDPKDVVRRELEDDGMAGFMGKRAWVEAAEDEWWEAERALNEAEDSDYEPDETSGSECGLLD